MNEFIYIVLVCKSPILLYFVFYNSPAQIICYARIKNSMIFIRKNINKIVIIHILLHKKTY